MSSKKSEWSEKDLIAKLEKLEIDKQEAIKNQQYERASNIRDQIRKYNEMLEDIMNSHG